MSRPLCPYCRQEQSAANFGFHRGGKLRFRCEGCGLFFDPQRTPSSTSGVPAALTGGGASDSEVRQTGGYLPPHEASPAHVLADREERSEHVAWRAIFVLVALAALGMLLLPLFTGPKFPGEHYVYLARSFMAGQLSVDDLPGGYPDWVPWNDHKYLPFGPFPAVALIPFLPLLDMGLLLVWVGHIFTLLNVWLFWRVLGKAGVGGARRRWALLLFFAGTHYLALAVVGNSWYFAHIVATGCLLLAIDETLGEARPLLVGALLGLAGLTRVTTLFALPFFLWMLWRREPSEDGAEETVRLPLLARFGLLGLGLAGPVVLLLVYNYVRFGNPLESGYSLAVLYHGPLIEARNLGVFSLMHVPKNLFMLLLQGPVPYPSQDAPALEFPYAGISPWGMGLLFVSPALLFAFRANWREPLVQSCWLAIGLVLVPLVTYYGVGWIQFGYRYSLDFLPFLLLVAARGFPNPITNLARSLVLLSVAVSIWGTLFLVTKI